MSHRAEVAGDRRNGRREELGQGNVVAGDQADVAGDGQIQFAQRAEHTDQDLVASGDDRRGRIGRAEHVEGGLVAVLGAEC